MKLYDGWKEILKIQKFRRIVGYTGFYCFTALISYAYTSNTTRAGFSRADQFYASYPSGTELLTDTAKLYKAALGNCFEEEEWGPIEWLVMAKHFERQGKSPYAYHAVRRERRSMDGLVISGFESCTRKGACLQSPANSVSLLVKYLEQYMAHLVSHGQLDGSG